MLFGRSRAKIGKARRARDKGGGGPRVFGKVISGVMVVSGLLTLTMLYAAFAPAAALQRFFGESAGGAALNVVTPNWGVLIGLIGALLLYGALHRQARSVALVVAGVSKLAFIGLVLAQGERYLSSLGAAIVVDSIMVALFAVFLMFGRNA